MPDQFAKLTDPVNPKSYAHKTVGWIPGIVIDNDDPERLGRVKVISPVIDADNPLPHDNDGWIPRITPYTLNEASGGTSTPIEIGTQVVMISMMGDINQLVIIGCLHSRTDRPYPEFDTKNNITGTMYRSGKVHLQDESEEGNGMEIKYFPSGLIESTTSDGGKTIQSKDGAVLQLDSTGGVRLENNKGYFSVGSDGSVEQGNNSDTIIALSSKGEIALKTPASPKITLNAHGVDVKSQKDELTDIKSGIRKGFAGTFSGAYVTYNALKGIKNAIKAYASNEYVLQQLYDAIKHGEKSFESFGGGIPHLEKLEAYDTIELGEGVLGQLDVYRKYNLEKIEPALTEALQDPSNRTPEAIASVIEGAVPGEVLSSINLNLEFLGDLFPSGTATSRPKAEKIDMSSVEQGDYSSISSSASSFLDSISSEDFSLTGAKAKDIADSFLGAIPEEGDKKIKTKAEEFVASFDGLDLGKLSGKNFQDIATGVIDNLDIDSGDEKVDSFVKGVFKQAVDPTNIDIEKILTEGVGLIDIDTGNKKADKVISNALSDIASFKDGVDIESIAKGAVGLIDIDTGNKKADKVISEALSDIASFEDGVDIKSIAKGAVGLINTGNEDIDGLTKSVLGSLISEGGIKTDALFSIGLHKGFEELGIQRNVADLLTNNLLDGDISLSDIGSVVMELGLAKNILGDTGLGEAMNDVFDFAFDKLDWATSQLNEANKFINEKAAEYSEKLNAMIMEHIKIPLPINLNAVISGYLGQVTGIITKAKDFIADIKNKGLRIEELMDKLQASKDSTETAEKVGGEVKTLAADLKDIAFKQKDLSPKFTSLKELARLLFEMQTIDTIDELPELGGVIAEIEEQGFDMTALKEKVLTPEVALTFPATNDAVNAFLDSYIQNDLVKLIDEVLDLLNPEQLKEGNKLLNKTIEQIPAVNGATVNGNKDTLGITADSLGRGGAMKLNKDLVSIMGPKGDKGLAPVFALDGNKASMKTAGADLGLGMLFEMDQKNLRFASPGGDAGLGSSISMDKDKISLHGPGAKSSVGSFIEIDNEKAHIYSPGGDQGIGTSIKAEVDILKLNGPGETKGAGNNCHIGLSSNSMSLCAPGGKQFAGSEIFMDSTTIHCRAGSDIPTDMRARLLLNPFITSLFAPHEATLFNGYLNMSRLLTELNGGELIGPNSNLKLTSFDATLSKREAFLEQSAIRLTDVTIDIHAGLPGVGPTLAMAPASVNLTNGPAAAFINLVGNTASISVTGGKGIFVFGPMIFIN